MSAPTTTTKETTGQRNQLGRSRVPRMPTLSIDERLL
jgi:hypothetical protein